MLKTPLYDLHERLGARLIDFGGWMMPVMYRSIQEEHVHTRTAASIFDVSHMGRLKFGGRDAERLLERVCTRNIGKLAVGRSGYSHLCDERGGVIDDVIVSRFEDHLYMVCNAGNREKVLGHLRGQMASMGAKGGATGGADVKIEDTTQATVMLAIQGPATMPMLAAAKEKLPIKVDEVKRYGFVTGSYMGMRYIVFRSGYTGEDGVEIVLPAMTGVLVWEYLTKERGTGDTAVAPGEGTAHRAVAPGEGTAHRAVAPGAVAPGEGTAHRAVAPGEGTAHRAVAPGVVTVKPAGLGARDTLRLEAGMCLYGHELNEGVDPLSAGCGWCVDLEKDFVGAEALRRIAAEGPRRRLVGLVLEGRRIARQGTKVFAAGGEVVGEVTSGTLSPTLGKSIAMAYVASEKTGLQAGVTGGQAGAGAGATLEVEIGGGRVGAVVQGLPFYRRGV